MFFGSNHLNLIYNKQYIAIIETKRQALDLQTYVKRDATFFVLTLKESDSPILYKHIQPLQNILLSFILGCIKHFHFNQYQLLI